MNPDPALDEDVIERERDGHDGESSDGRPAEELIEESDGNSELEGCSDNGRKVHELIGHPEGVRRS